MPAVALPELAWGRVKAVGEAFLRTATVATVHGGPERGDQTARNPWKTWEHVDDGLYFVKPGFLHEDMGCVEDRRISREHADAEAGCESATRKMLGDPLSQW
jgi:hypothetical protein